MENSKGKIEDLINLYNELLKRRKLLNGQIRTASNNIDSFFRLIIDNCTDMEESTRSTYQWCTKRGGYCGPFGCPKVHKT